MEITDARKILENIVLKSGTACLPEDLSSILAALWKVADPHGRVERTILGLMVKSDAMQVDKVVL